MDNDLAIEIVDVAKNYGSLQALKGLKLQIRRGEFFGLLGPNGAGKSTLINILAGLSRASAGHVRVMGHDVVTHYRRARRCLGVVPQELVFDPFFTVREVLRIQAGYFGLGRGNYAWIEELMDALMLADKADTNMRALSGGMKRRVLIAQALVHKPQVLVLDEPTAGVDVELRQSLWRFVQRLHEDGHTIVLTTHYLEEAEMLCGRIGILNQGQLVALDTTASLLAHNMGGQRRYFLVLDRELDRLPASLDALPHELDGRRLTLQMDPALSVSEVVSRLAASNVSVTDIQSENVDLEDVFVALTKREAS